MRSPHVWTRLLAGLGLLASIGLGGGRATADDRVQGARSSALREREHLARVEIDRGHATLVVRRTVHNGGARHDQASFWLDIPTTAVATNLRTLGTIDGRPRWFVAELMEAEAAAARYRELTGIGGYYPKDPALLSWRHQGLLALQVFPVAPRDDKTIEYTLTMPTEYRGGRDHLVVPAMGTAELRALATVQAIDARGAVFAEGRSIAPGALVRLDHAIDFAAARSQPRALGGALAAVTFGKGRVLLRQRVEAAPKVAEAPRGARVVVILDASRSLSERDAEAEVAAAHAYLSHLPDAEVATLLFDRRVTALHDGFAPAKRALAELDRLTIRRVNGSHADDALARAAALLAAAPARAPRRVLLLTDTLARSSVGAPALRALAAKTGAIVHVGVVRETAPALARDDDHAWDKVVRPTGGLVWQAGATVDTRAAAAMRAVYEEWARPVRVDRLRVTVPGLDAARFGYPDRLDEGEGFADLRIVDRPLGWLKVEGELWSQPISTVLSPDEDEGRTAAALVFGSDSLHELDEPEMMVLARLGHAVSPVTSLLAIEPGVRPSTEGLAEGEGGGGRGEGIGLGSIGTIGYGAGVGRAVDYDALLRGLLAPGWKACGGAGRKAKVTLETTYREVVDVPAASVDGPGGAALARCLAEAAWSVDLPVEFAMERRTFKIEP